MQELEEQEAHTGVAVPAEAAALRGLWAQLPKRRSCDPTDNASGRRLQQLCMSHNLVAMNGRLPGDREGAVTFTAQRGRNKSLIDYIVASPDLTFTQGGQPHRGCRMHVTEVNKLPPRPSLNTHTVSLFDHAPVGIRFRACSTPKAPTEPKAVTKSASTTTWGEKWVWRPELLEDFYSALELPEVHEYWGRIGAGCSAADAVKNFRKGLAVAVEQVHSTHGRVILRQGLRKQRHGRPNNAWYDAECTRLRTLWKEAIRDNGHDSDGANAARHTYRVHVRRCKSEHESRTRQNLVRCLYDDPRHFWREFQAHDRGAGVFTVEQWTDWFRNLLSANTSADYIGGTLESHCEMFSDLFPEPSAQDQAAAAHLNAPFSVVEVNSALGGLEDHKATGIDGMPSEFLSKACTRTPAEREGSTPAPQQHTLAPVITRTLNAVFDDKYPTEWQTSALAPVPKPKGRVDRQTDHRGIACQQVMGKLYSATWTARLDRWAESKGLRARGQAGFRRGRGTPDQLFVLRHVLDTARVQKKTVYCAFIDFSKAYDRVDRDLMKRVLRGCGLHGRALHAVSDMIEVTRMQVRAAGKLGESFDTTAGLRQGCPASPILFGILIDRLERYLEQHCSEYGVQLGGKLLRALLYADDVVLMSETAEGLQAMLNRLYAFCRGNSMFVNLDKSEVVVFQGGARGPRAGVRPGSPGPFTYNGGQLALKPSYIYLGLNFENGQPIREIRASLGRAVEKARKAMHAVFSRCYAMGLHNVNLQCHLFDSLVKPVLSYGCEVWAVDWVSRMCQTGNFAAGAAEDTVHKPFLRQSMGVAKSTTTVAMFRELGRQPLAMFWLRMAAQLWNRALESHSEDWLRKALYANVTAARSATSEADRNLLWAHHFTSCMQTLGITWRGSTGVLLKIDCTALNRAMVGKWTGYEQSAVHRTLSTNPAWAEQPLAVRAAPESFKEGFKLFVYDTWFATDTWRRKQSWAYHLHRPEHIRAVAQFRLGSHWLGIQRGRGRQRRSERCCRCCGTVEDELHVMECSLYTETRTALIAQVPDMWTDAGVRQAFTRTDGEGWETLATFLCSCRRKLAEQDNTETR
jgi:hypothetical protein